MTAPRAVSAVVGRLQASKLIATVVGILLALGVGSSHSSSLIAGELGLEPVVVLMAVGLGLAAVVIAETLYAARLALQTPGHTVETTPLLRAAELSVAVCLVGGVLLWQLRGDRPPLPPAGVEIAAGGMVAISFVRSTTALWERQTAARSDNP